MSEPTAEAATTVDEDGIRVEKSFTDDAFPVPAVRYELSSHREDPVRVRIVDRIPESFPMDRIGFHPEYESENWTAYKDHRVEFERVLDPDETVETVFGIRDDDPDLDGFLGTPVIEHVPVGEEIEDVLGAGDTDAVREVLSGDRATLPGMAEDEEFPPEDPAEAAETEDVEANDSEPDPAEADAPADDAEPEPPEPRSVSAGTPVVTARGGDSEVEPVEATDSVADESDGVADESEDPEPEVADPEADEDDETEAGETGATAEDDSVESAARFPGEGGLAAALAAEIRTGAADEEDIATIEEAFDAGVPRSVDVRIARLQSSVADIEAYADALAEFIDGEGTAREILDGIDERVDAVESEMAALDDRLDEADDEREAIESDVARVDDAVESTADTVDDVAERVDDVEGDVDDVDADVRELGDDVEAAEEDVDELAGDVDRLAEETDAVAADVDDLGDDVETLYEETDKAAERAEDAAERAEDAEERVEETETRVDDLESSLDSFDEEFDDLWDDLAEVDTRLTDIEDRLGEDLDDVEAELDEINDHLDELDEFRKRLNEAFGP